MSRPVERPAWKLAFRLSKVTKILRIKKNDDARPIHSFIHCRTDTTAKDRLVSTHPDLRRPKPPPPPERFPISVPTKRRILCVDDQDDMCSLIATILSDHEVVSAHSKAEAIRKATSGLFDLYLLDYYLPDGTGLEVCLLIRDFDDSTPILFVTDFTELTRQQIENVNAQGIVWKQDLPDGLTTAISKIFRPQPI